MLSNHIAMWMEKLLITTFLCFFESVAIFEIRVRIQTFLSPKVLTQVTIKMSLTILSMEDILLLKFRSRFI